MDTTLKAILSVLTSGNKTSSEIANELGFAPAKMTALLATLVSRKEVKKVGKIHSNGKEVAIYAHARNDDQAPVQSKQKTDSDFEMARRLHQLWGGYLLVDSSPSKRSLTLKHKIE